jgi:hypothetical protein
MGRLVSFLRRHRFGSSLDLIANVGSDDLAAVGLIGR